MKRVSNEQAVLANRLAVTVAVGLCVAPVLLGFQAVLGDIHIAAIIAGTLLGTAFLASTPAISLLFAGRPPEKLAVLLTYLLKISVLGWIAIMKPWPDLHRPSFAVSVVVSALAYLSAQLVLEGRPPRRDETSPRET